MPRAPVSRLYLQVTNALTPHLNPPPRGGRESDRVSGNASANSTRPSPLVGEGWVGGSGVAPVFAQYFLDAGPRVDRGDIA